MHKRLYEFLENNNNFTIIHLVSAKIISAIFALLQITERIRETFDKGKFKCGIFIDLRKAFDTVNQQILPQKLNME